MANKNPKFDNMLKARQELIQTKINAVIRVTQEICELPNLGIITKSMICEMAGVSKPFIYRHPELLEKINEVIIKSDFQIPREAAFMKMSSNSQKVLIDTLKRRIEALQEENMRLKREKQILYGKLSQLDIPY